MCVCVCVTTTNGWAMCYLLLLLRYMYVLCTISILARSVRTTASSLTPFPFSLSDTSGTRTVSNVETMIVRDSHCTVAEFFFQHRRSNNSYIHTYVYARRFDTAKPIHSLPHAHFFFLSIFT